MTRALCPACRGDLVRIAEDRVRCATHGGEYRLLHARQGVLPWDSARGPGLEPGTACRAHPEVEAAFTCAGCGRLGCSTCDFAGADGLHRCPSCVVTAHGPSQLRCSAHPEVRATMACATCRKPCCATCDFAFPGGVHLCPDCAVTTPAILSPKRAKMRAWSIACAALATISVGATMCGGAMGMPDEVAGALFSMLVFVPAIVGTGLGMGSYDRRLVNPPSVWIAAGWNLGVLALTLILVIVGMVAG